jgi:hypothetical protein
MNKRVTKPKRKLPLIPDGNVTDAQMERYLRAHHDEIDAKLQDGKAALDRGESVELHSLEELLAGVRKRTAGKR